VSVADLISSLAVLLAVLFGTGVYVTRHGRPTHF
jgi:hypothetical protein